MYIRWTEPSGTDVLLDTDAVVKFALNNRTLTAFDFGTPPTALSSINFSSHDIAIAVLDEISKRIVLDEEQAAFDVNEFLMDKELS